MKVLHVIPSVSPIRGGPSYMVFAMIKSLRAQGMDAEVLTTNDNGVNLLDAPLLKRVEYESVPVWFAPRLLPPMKEFIFSPSATKWLWKNIQSYDVVHIHYLFSYVPTCASVICRIKRIPYVISTHDQLSPWSLSQSCLRKKAYLKLVERRNLQKVSAIHCTAASESDSVKAFGISAPSFIAPLGVDIPEAITDASAKLRKAYDIPSQVPVILFLARLHPKKRLDVLIEAAYQLVQQGEKFHLLIAGAGDRDYCESLKDSVKALNLCSHISFSGFVQGESKNLALQGSDIFALPSHSENFGIAVAEAMAVHLPVVITPGVKISPEIAVARAGLVVEGEPSLFANAIQTLLRSTELRSEMGENGYRLVTEQYSWQKAAQRLGAAYERCCLPARSEELSPMYSK